MKNHPGCTVALVWLAAVHGLASSHEPECTAIGSLTIENVRIDVAEAIVPDPVWPIPPHGLSPSYPPDFGVRTPFCRVAGVIEEEIGFEVWLPEAWSGRFQQVGNGGYFGEFFYDSATIAVEQGYAVATTDLGHKVTDAMDTSWAVGRPDRIENFGHRAHHLVADAARQIVIAHYGRPHEYAYFTGCSAGGRQGLIEAALYPGDFDGVLAIAPATDLVRRNTTQFWWQAHFPLIDRISADSASLVAAAAIAHCDADDGVVDGIISLPESCAFDPGVLLCEAGEDIGQCLTLGQIEHVRLVHGRRSTAGGLALHPGHAWGTLVPDVSDVSPAVSLTELAPTSYEWSPETFDFDRDFLPLEAELGAILGRTGPDLSDFASRGGKLIVVHGWTDGTWSPYSTIDYFMALHAEMGAGTVDDFARLYMAPGMDHCAGGAGPDAFDALPLLVRWVETGTAPDRLLASKHEVPVWLDPDSEPTMTRPLCPYPQVAVYDGRGNPDRAESFVCEVR